MTDKKYTVSTFGDLKVSNYLVDIGRQVISTGTFEHPLYPEVAVEKPSTSVTLIPVKLQSQIDARISYTGQVTQRQYYWARAGSVVSVDSLDAPYLLEKRIKSQSCCNSSDVAVFIQID